MTDFPAPGRIIQGVDPDSHACSMNYLYIFEQVLMEKGQDTEAWIARAGIPDQDRQDPNAFVSFMQMEKLLEDEAVVALFGEIGFDVGERLNITAHGLVGQMAMSGNTYMDTIRLFLRFIKLRTQLTRFDISLRGLDIIISFSDAIEHAGLRRLVVDSALSGSYHLVNQLFDSKRAVARIEFDGEPTPWQQAFVSKAYCPVTFGHARPSIAISLLAATRRAHTANPLLQKVAEQQCASLLQELEAAATVTQKIRTLLNTIPEYALSQQRVAESLGMTPRTLRRRLAEEGNNFSDLADAVIKEYVTVLMQQGSLSVGDMADLLGYSNESNFNKACKRWFGVSAVQLKKAQG